MKKDPLYFFLWVSAQAQEKILMINNLIEEAQETRA